MTPQKLEELKNKIQEANPEIMELKFGCEVEGFNSIRGIIVRINLYVNESNTYSIFWEDDTLTMQSSIGITKILGRPIRLADVLLAILGPFDKPRLSAGWQGLEAFMTPYIHWNLRDDNLNNQSPQTQEFIFNLICRD